MKIYNIDNKKYYVNDIDDMFDLIEQKLGNDFMNDIKKEFDFLILDNDELKENCLSMETDIEMLNKDIGELELEMEQLKENKNE